MSYMIKDLPQAELPREKAMKYGFNSLSNSELLAILLRTGAKDVSVKDVALEVLKTFNDLEGLKEARIAKLTNIYGVGEVKAITLMAAIELGRRMHCEKTKELVQIKESREVYTYYASFFLEAKQEKFLVLFLNAKNEVINQKIIFIGTANQSLVHPRDVFQEAVFNNAVAVLCIHNHPSGNASPSLEDERITKTLIEAGRLLSIPIIDHVIIGHDCYYSFLEHGKVN